MISPLGQSRPFCPRPTVRRATRGEDPFQNAKIPSFRTVLTRQSNVLRYRSPPCCIRVLTTLKRTKTGGLSFVQYSLLSLLSHETDSNGMVASDNPKRQGDNENLSYRSFERSDLKRRLTNCNHSRSAADHNRLRIGYLTCGRSCLQKVFHELVRGESGSRIGALLQHLRRSAKACGVRDSAFRTTGTGLTVGSRPLYNANAPSFLTIWETNSTLLVLPMPTTLLALC
jgi:hypothetical protein